MEVRCSSCNKLFRVSDDKIIGSGVKFKCTRCGETVKITKENFDQYLSKTPAPALAAVQMSETKAAHQAASPAAAQHPGESDRHVPDLAAALAGTSQHPADGLAPQKQPAAQALEPKSEDKAGPKPAPTRQTATHLPTATRETSRPGPLVIDAAPVHPPKSSGFGKKLAILVIMLFIIGGAGFFGVTLYFKNISQFISGAAGDAILPDGLQVQNASGTIDPAKGDLVVTGMVQNSTDKPKPAWYILVEVYDAQGAVLTKGKLVSGKQLYTRRDFEILAKRGVNIRDLQLKNVQEQGVIIPPKGSVNFEFALLEPPIGIASFNATLQPFDPVQLFKEMAEEQK